MASAPCTPASPTMPSAASASTSTSPVVHGETQKRERRQLPLDARAILRKYVDSDGSANLTRDDKLRILAEVHKVPGAEWYSYSEISRFYYAKRKRVGAEAQGDAGKKRNRRASEQRTTDDILWPSLTAKSIESLRVLVRETPNPTPTHIAVWSSRLGANQEHVQAWLQLSTPQADDREEREEQDGFVRPALPTPEATASPEPQYCNIPATPVPPTTGPSYVQTYSEYAYPIPTFFSAGAYQQPALHAHIPMMAVQPVTHYQPPTNAPGVPTKTTGTSPAASSVADHQPLRWRSPMTCNTPSPRASSTISNQGPSAGLEARFVSPIRAADAALSHSRRTEGSRLQPKAEPLSPVEATAHPIPEQRIPLPIPRINLAHRASSGSQSRSGSRSSSVVPLVPSEVPAVLPLAIPPPVVETPSLSRRASPQAQIMRFPTLPPRAEGQQALPKHRRLSSFLAGLRAKLAEEPALSDPLQPLSPTQVERMLENSMKLYDDIIKGTFAHVGLVAVPSSDADGEQDMDLDDD